MPHVTKKRKMNDKGALALRKVNRLMATRELKAHYINRVLSVAAIVSQISDIAQGDTNETRDGHMATAKRLEVSCTVHALNVQGVDGPQVCDIALVLDKRQQVGTAPNFDAIWRGTAERGFHTNNDNRDRFQVLRKRRIILHVPSLNSGNVAEYTAETFEWDVPFKRGLKLQWDGASGTSYVGNGLYLTFDRHAFDAGGPSLSLEFASKLTFTDA